MDAKRAHTSLHIDVYCSASREGHRFQRKRAEGHVTLERRGIPEVRADAVAVRFDLARELGVCHPLSPEGLHLETRGVRKTAGKLYF